MRLGLRFDPAPLLLSCPSHAWLLLRDWSVGRSPLPPLPPPLPPLPPLPPASAFPVWCFGFPPSPPPLSLSLPPLPPPLSPLSPGEWQDWALCFTPEITQPLGIAMESASLASFNVQVFLGRRRHWKRDGNPSNNPVPTRRPSTLEKAFSFTSQIKNNQGSWKQQLSQKETCHERGNCEFVGIMVIQHCLLRVLTTFMVLL